MKVSGTGGLPSHFVSSNVRPGNNTKHIPQPGMDESNVKPPDDVDELEMPLNLQGEKDIEPIKNSRYPSKVKSAYKLSDDIKEFASAVGKREAGELRAKNAIAHFKCSLEESCVGQSTFSNINVADALLESVKNEIYKQGLKAPNKSRFPAILGSEYSAAFHRESQRRIIGVREGMKGTNAALREEIRNYPKAMEEAMVASAHNCNHITLAAAGVLKKSGIAVRADRIHFHDYDHAVLLLGATSPYSLPADMRKWPADLAICDVWANISCHPSAYHDKLMEKLVKYEKDGKYVFEKGWKKGPPANLEAQLLDKSFERLC